MITLTRWVGVALVLGTVVSPRAYGQTPDRNTRAPRLVTRVAPLDYPSDLRFLHLEGSVLLRATIDSTGQPDRGSIQVLQSTDQRLDDAAREFVLHSAYYAGRIDGRKVTMPLEISVRFELRG